MTGKNYNSKTGEYTELVNRETIDSSIYARKLKDKGYKVSEIANKMKLSKTRIYQYFKD